MPPRNIGYGMSAFALHMRDVGRFDLIDAETEVALAQQGDHEAFICANLRLVISFVRKHGYTIQDSSSLDFLDLVQEGHIGLIIAVRKWDWQLGFKFSSYALWWIRAMVNRALSDQSRMIRLPTNVAEDLGKVQKARNLLLNLTDKTPTPSQIAEQAGISVEAVERVLVYEQIMPKSIDEAVALEAVWVKGLATRELSPADQLVQASVKGRIREIVDSLQPRDAYILRLRFGFEDGTPYTLLEVGNKLGLTKERIRQLQNEALRRLKESHGEELRAYTHFTFSPFELPAAPGPSVPDAETTKRVEPKGRKRVARSSDSPPPKVRRHSAKWYIGKLQAIAERIGRTPTYPDLLIAYREGYGFDHEGLYDHFANIKRSFRRGRSSLKKGLRQR